MHDAVRVAAAAVAHRRCRSSCCSCACARAKEWAWPNRYRSLGMALGNAAGWGFGLFQLFFFPVLSSLLGGPAPQFAFFATIVSALMIVLVLFLPETKGISFGGEE